MNRIPKRTKAGQGPWSVRVASRTAARITQRARAVPARVGHLGEDGGDAQSPKVAKAVAFLRAELAAGPLPRATIVARAAAAGIVARTLRRAKQVLGVTARREGGAWLWRLASTSPSPRVDAMLGLSRRPVGTMADFAVGSVVQVASGAWVQLVDLSPCLATVQEPGRGRREVALGTEVFDRVPTIGRAVEGLAAEAAVRREG